MAYVATQSLRWGEDTIPAGAAVPAGEPGRDYAGMIHLGQIREVDDTAGLSDDQVLKQLIEVTGERDALKGRVAELEADDGEVPTVEIPEGVVPGETPGWPLVVLPMPDETRELLAEGEVSGTFTLDELRETVDLLRDAARPAEAGGVADGEQAADDSGEGPSDDELPDGVVESSPGWFTLPDGRKVRRRDIPAVLSGAEA